MILAPLYTLTTAYVDIRNYDVLLKRIKDGPNALLND